MWPTHYIPNQPRVEGVPPPRYYLTTPPYPIELTEELESDGGIYRIGFVPFASTEDYLQPSGQPVSGVLTTRLVTADAPDEYLTSAGAPVSGVLTERLVRIVQDPENLTTTALPLSGILRDPLVVYENWPLGVDTEDLISAGLPVSGVLSS